MWQKTWWTNRKLGVIVLAVLLIEVCNGFVNTFLFTRPFWIDEWRVIYNLKTRNAEALWEKLDFLQQFPRAYLTIVKLFTSAFDYSYSALRFPSFLVGCCVIWMAWRLMRRIYAGEWFGFLFPLIIASSVPFTKYFVQTKQYTMDVLLSLVALWQVLELLALLAGTQRKTATYFVLCASLLLAPFFSYTYPITIAPAFVLCLVAWKKALPESRRRILFPLLLCAAGIAGAFWFDVRQLLADGGMKAFWRYNFAPALGWAGILECLYDCFAHAGSGFVFENIFGLLGTVATVRAIWMLRDRGARNADFASDHMRRYALTLLTIVFVLFLAGHLPLGEHRLNVFITPSVALLVIDLLRSQQRRTAQRAALVTGAILLIGVGGHIITTMIGSYTEPTLAQKRKIYFAIGTAIRDAKAEQLSILATPAVAFPYNTDPNLPDTAHTVPGDWVLKTHPAYHFRDSIAVYSMRTAQDGPRFLDTASLSRALVVDGANISFLRR